MAIFNGKEILFSSSETQGGDVKELPSITVADNGKVLTAQNGSWVAKSVSSTGGGTTVQFISLTGQFGEVTEEEYSALVSNPINYIRFLENGNCYNCYLSESTGNKMTYSSGMYIKSDGKKAVKYIELYSDRLWSINTYTLGSTTAEDGNGVSY